MRRATFETGLITATMTEQCCDNIVIVHGVSCSKDRSKRNANERLRNEHKGYRIALACSVELYFGTLRPAVSSTTRPSKQNNYSCKTTRTDE